MIWIKSEAGALSSARLNAPQLIQRKEAILPGTHSPQSRELERGLHVQGQIYRVAACIAIGGCVFRLSEGPAGLRGADGAALPSLSYRRLRSAAHAFWPRVQAQRLRHARG